MAPVRFFNVAEALARLTENHQKVDKRAKCRNLKRSGGASVAQLAEQLTLNQLVLGSSPSRGTTFPQQNE
jgi:hypothetical protein